MAGSMGEVGEFGLVARVTASLATGPGVLVGPGDDAAVVAAPDGRVVATTDVLVEGRHFRLDWSSPYDVGRKAAAQNLADVAAMGARATALVCGLAAPASFPLADAEALARGLSDEAALVGAYVVGGDVVACDTVVVAVTAFGDLGGRAPVTRGGARPGDVLVVAGTLGGSAAGLAALRAGRPDLAAVAAHRVPSPPYDAGPELAAYGATAMIDVSDGLTGDLAHVAAASGVGFVVDVAALPRHPAVAEAAAALGLDPVAWVLAGGEDHALVATLPAPVPGYAVVGRAVAEPGITWEGVDVVPRSYDHFG
ncbi:MAG TPA: thiamine-phosphate kinase [Frankiaceae bacterium]|nr:thiamine-phosphate kinase [Frankiaceae bacterium]